MTANLQDLLLPFDTLLLNLPLIQSFFRFKNPRTRVWLRNRSFLYYEQDFHYPQKKLQKDFNFYISLLLKPECI